MDKQMRNMSISINVKYMYSRYRDSVFFQRHMHMKIHLTLCIICDFKQCKMEIIGVLKSLKFPVHNCRTENFLTLIVSILLSCAYLSFFLLIVQG